MQAGHRLEILVSDRLSALGVRHQRMAPQSKPDIEDKIDFLVWSRWCSKPFEVQLTLRRKELGKIRRFVAASLVTFGTRGTRVYLEVIAGHGQDLAGVARRVAEALRTIVTHFRDFGPLNMLGVRVKAMGNELEKFHLHDIVGWKWIRSILPEIEAKRAELEARREAQRLVVMAARRIPFWNAFRTGTPRAPWQSRELTPAFAAPSTPRVSRSFYPLRLM